MFKFLQKLFGFDTPAPQSAPAEELDQLEERNTRLTAHIEELTRARMEIREKIDAIHARTDAARGRG